MSASSKKKSRADQNSLKMTERQLAEQKEAKKLKVLTITFTAVIALILVTALAFTAIQFMNNSGIREKNTVAAVIGGQELSNAQLNYYYIGAVNEFLNTYGSYASLFGLDTSKPLDQQYIDEATGKTWADDFLTAALANAKATYAVVAEAQKNGFSLTEDQKTAVENEWAYLDAYAQANNYGTGEDYVKALYGPGASKAGYLEFIEMNTLAQAYYSKYAADLTYDEAALREAEKGKEAEFSSFSYNSYYLNVSNFLGEGTKAEDGTVTYTDKQRAEAEAKVKAAAEELLKAEIASIEDFDAAIAALEVNAEAETAPTSTAYTKSSYANVNATIQEWVTASARKAGDMEMIPNTTTTKNEDGTETTKVNGYYVVYFVASSDNNFPLVNVRHILIKPEGTQGSYTAQQMAGAKVQAEALLKQWQEGKGANEDTFAELAKTNSADGSASNGGLIEDIYPDQMVKNFNDWCFAEGRKVGDTGIVESEYGYHVMYFSGNSERIYRDLLIENSLRSAAVESWYTALLEAVTVEEKNTQYLSRDLILTASN